jgi:hypothetical protein
MVGVEVKQVSVATGSAYAQDVLERLFVIGLCWKSFDHFDGCIG